jgi:hypothetical protein
MEVGHFLANEANLEARLRNSIQVSLYAQKYMPFKILNYHSAKLELSKIVL